MEKYNIVVFDLDSTLVKIEGLDWLASLNGRGKLVKALTKRSMNGEISFKEVLNKKMRIIAPSHNDLILLGKEYCKNLVEDVKKVIYFLQKLNKEVWIVTGNFDPAVSILANKLGIPKENAINNKVYFDAEGNYNGFNSKSPLAHNNGKTKIIKKMKKDKKKIVFIGDGYTDLEVMKCVDLFIGYGGAVTRNIVKSNSNYYIMCESLSPLLLLCLTKDEIYSLGSWNSGLLKKAIRLLKTKVKRVDNFQQ